MKRSLKICFVLVVAYEPVILINQYNKIYFEQLATVSILLLLGKLKSSEIIEQDCKCYYNLLCESNVTSHDMRANKYTLPLLHLGFIVTW